MAIELLRKLEKQLYELSQQPWISTISEKDPCQCEEDLLKLSRMVAKFDQEISKTYVEIGEILTERSKKNPYANCLCRNCGERTLDSERCCSVCGSGTVEKVLEEITGKIENLCLEEMEMYAQKQDS